MKLINIHTSVICKKRQCNFSDKMVKMSLSLIFLAIILSLVKGNPSHMLKHDKPTVSNIIFKNSAHLLSLITYFRDLSYIT